MGVPTLHHAPTATVAECQTTRLQTIKQMTVLPEQYTPRSQALTALKRIESIEVNESVKRSGHRYYVIDIYYKLSRSHIPTNCGIATKPRDPWRRPDARIERRLSEIVNLRDEIYYFAHNGHGPMPCQFCCQIVDYVLHGCAKPRSLLRWLDGEGEILATLTQFFNDNLRLVTTVKAHGGHQCQGQDNIPTLVEHFLFPGVNSNTAQVPP